MIGAISPRLDGYAFSLTGRSHREQGIPCQDSHILSHRRGSWQLAAFADGVGSASYSHQGAACILSALTSWCEPLLEEQIDADPQEILREGFAYALDQTVRLARSEGNPIAAYDATLTACLFDGETAVYGHAGDGGLIAVDEQGHYHLLTSAQKGEAWNEVYPLRSGAAWWSFGKTDFLCRAVILLTDGLLDEAIPSLLTRHTNPIHCSFLRSFLPSKRQLDVIESLSVEETLLAMLQGERYSHLGDDLTAVALWQKAEGIPEPEPEYFAEPDWEALRRERYDQLYPQLRPGEEEPNAAAKLPGDG